MLFEVVSIAHNMKRLWVFVYKVTMEKYWLKNGGSFGCL